MQLLLVGQTYHILDRPNSHVLNSTLRSAACKSIFLILLASVMHCQSWNRFWDTNPVISAVSPASNTSVRNTKVSYTFSELCASASITWTATGGSVDANSPHIRALVGAELTAGAHNSISITNDPSLRDGAVYSLTFTCTGASGAQATPVISSNVAYIPATASKVYGQFGSFTCNVSDNIGNCTSGGVTKSANGLNQPNAIAFDAGGAYIADKGNNRVLYFPNGSTTATRVYGQGGNFTTGIPNSGGITANSLSTPTAVATDANGVYIVDRGNNRVLYYIGTSTTATRLYGQVNGYTCGLVNGDAACGTSAITDQSLGQPEGIAVDANGVYIAEFSNHRVTFYPGTSTTAARFYGQTLSTGGAPNNGGLSSSSLQNPYRVSVTSDGVHIVDYGNNRVLFYPGTSTTATRVYGQGGSFISGTANNGGISANSLSSPSGIAIDSLGVYIADFTNNRVLFYPGTSTTATRVYAQGGSFTTGTANNGGLSAQSLNQPVWVATDSDGVYIMDTSNHRGLFY